VISCSLFNLTSLSIFYSPSASSEDLDSLSKLTNLEKINLRNIEHLVDDAIVVNYSTLAKMKSIAVSWCDGLSGLGLSYLVANKQFLVQLKIFWCDGISSEGYHCLTTLSNLTHISIRGTDLDDIGLNMICSSCLLIEYLDIRGNRFITIEGLKNIHLKFLSINGLGDDWLSKLSINTTITDLDLSNSNISNEGLSHLSSLVNLSKLFLNGCRNIDHNLVSQIFAFPISIFFEKG
jgi:Leucine-rich repeat (LRR) protein